MKIHLIRSAGLGALAFMLMASNAQAAETPAAKTGGQTDNGIQEILVTAERHVSSVQKTPLSITVLGEDALKQKGITTGQDVADVVPGVKVMHEMGVTNVYIRGVGNTASNPYADSGVTFNLDGVALTLPSGAGGQMYDLARMEVLKGPQGTLYGRNATAGVMNIVTRDPDFVRGGYANVTFGNYDNVETEGAFNLPLSDTLAARVAFHTSNHKGYLTNGNNDEDGRGARLKLLWKPSSGTRLVLGVDFDNQSGKGAQRVPVKSSDGSFYFNSALGINNPWYMQNTMPSPVGGNTQIVPSDAHVNNRNWGIFAQLDQDVGIGVLTVLPSYREYRQDWKSADDGFGFQQNVSDKSKSLEVRLGSYDDRGSRLKWVLGAYGLSESLPNIVSVQQSFPIIGATSAEQANMYLQTTGTPYDKTNSYAFFAQATYRVLPVLRITGGIRYTHDSKHETGYTTNDISYSPHSQYTFNEDWRAVSQKTTWRVGFDLDLAPQSMLYGNIATGYKAGGFGAGPTPGLTPGLTVDPTLVPLLTYKPEELTSYELGIKNSFLDRRLQVNLQGFYWNYKNQQIQTIFLFPLPSLPPVIVPSVVNAGAGKTYGADLDITYRFSSHDQIGVSLEVLGSKYDNFVYPFLFTSGLNQDKSGRPFNYAPSLSGSVDYSHVWDLANGGNVTLRAGVRFSASYWMSYNYDSASRQGAYSKTDLSLEYAAPEHAWFARAWVRNLENSAVLSYVGGSVPGTSQAPAPSGVSWATIQPPRTFGASFGVKF